MDQTVRDYVVEQTHRLMEAFPAAGRPKRRPKLGWLPLEPIGRRKRPESMYRSWRRIWSLWTS